MVDFLFIIIEHFRYRLRLRRYKRKSVEAVVFEGVGRIQRIFQTEGRVAHQPLLVSEN